jgi:hypothetical protein
VNLETSPTKLWEPGLNGIAWNLPWTPGISYGNRDDGLSAWNSTTTNNFFAWRRPETDTEQHADSKGFKGRLAQASSSATPMLTPLEHLLGGLDLWHLYEGRYHIAGRSQA